MEAVEATASGLDVQKGQTLEDMSGMVHQLSMKIAERKSRLAPIIKELRPLRLVVPTYIVHITRKVFFVRNHMMTMSVFLPCSQYCEISIFNFFFTENEMCKHIFLLKSTTVVF